MSILDKPVSYFPSIRDTHGGVTVSLLRILASQQHRQTIQQLRAEDDDFRQKRLKESLPCFTVSGVFRSRTTEGLIKPSGLAAVDLDSVDSYDPMQVLKELRKIPFIAYAGLSCRGKRLFAIVPIQFPDLYARHYTRLIRSFEDIGLPMGDSCHKVLPQPRFVSYNTENTQFFNHHAQKYFLLDTLKTYHIPSKGSIVNKVNLPENPFSWCTQQVNKSHNFRENNRHAYILQLSRYCNLKGLDENTTLTGCKQFACAGFHENEIISIVKHVYTQHRNSHNRYPFQK